MVLTRGGIEAWYRTGGTLRHKTRRRSFRCCRFRRAADKRAHPRWAQLKRLSFAAFNDRGGPTDTRGGSRRCDHKAGLGRDISFADTGKTGHCQRRATSRVDRPTSVVQTDGHRSLSKRQAFPATGLRAVVAGFRPTDRAWSGSTKKTICG